MPGSDAAPRDVSKLQAHPAVVGKRLASPPAPKEPPPFVFSSPGPGVCFNSEIKDSSFSSKSPVSSRRGAVVRNRHR